MADVRREVRGSKGPAAAPPDERKEQRPLTLRGADIVSFSLVALLVISVIAVLYVARAFFLPTVTALVIGTMLSPAAKFLGKYGIPRSVSAVLIVSATFAGLTFMIALISAPVMEWSTRIPELGPSLKDKLHVFDRPLAFWHQLQGVFGATPVPGEPTFSLPKIE